MAISNPYQQYQTNAATTASPGELTLMLYNGCLKFIHLAGKAIEEGNIEERNTNIQKAQNIIREFMVTLNMDIEISKSLMSMYDYMNRRLMDANLKNDLEILKEVEGYVVDFRNTWKEAIQINKQAKPMQGGRA
ncbi:flagellar export chaperone FliS [Bacillus sp. PS06]|uniref:flagellar export chaperone FliS n=1 Tax=Bacillus sp. PS06 TaxID=2764176 RepID=UPI001786C239|nr:flagellar export chaperone FliS [Bacillus sp. PS06]MBD8071405.1 flagellar export chaperone FliS [Bacillus sp. PS06]